jgi:hypothetical protein
MAIKYQIAIKYTIGINYFKISHSTATKNRTKLDFGTQRKMYTIIHQFESDRKIVNVTEKLSNFINRDPNHDR